MFYEQYPDVTMFFQGDILRNFPVSILSEKLKIVRLKKKYEDFSVAHIYEESKLNDAFANGSESILAKAFLMNVMILSQTCDIEHREFVSIAPIFPLSNVENISTQNAIRKRKVFYRFYLPSEGDFEESFLDITTINSVSRSTLRLEDRFLSISHYGRSNLAHFVYNYFNRPFILV